MFPSFECNKLLTSMNKIKFQKWISEQKPLNNPHFPAKTSMYDVYMYQSITSIWTCISQSYFIKYLDMYQSNTFNHVSMHHSITLCVGNDLQLQLLQ